MAQTTLFPVKKSPVKESQKAENVTPQTAHSVPRNRLQFFGGVGVIGGNKICLTASNEKGILLDFGWGFDTSRKYLNNYMDLRSSEVLFDGIALKELPPPTGDLAGIYREDLYANKAADLLKRFPFEQGKPKCITEVLICHCHSDHIGNIVNLHPDITLVCSETNKLVLEHLDATTKVDSFFAGIIKFKSFFSTDSDTGEWSEDKGGKEDVQKRNIRIITPGVPLKCAADGFEITFMDTDHSMPGAGGFLIKDIQSGLKVVYTGDIRQHGPNRAQAERFIQAAREFAPDILITEGTRIGREEEKDEFPSEPDVEAELTRVFKQIANEKTPKIICFECSNKDVWRLRSFYHAADSIGRTLVVSAKEYDLLKRCVDAKLLSDFDYSKIRVYLPKKKSGLYAPIDYTGNNDIKTVFRKTDAEIPVTLYKTGSKKGTPKPPAVYETIDPAKKFGIRAEEIRENPGNFVVDLPFFTMMEFCDILPSPGSYYITSKSAPFDDEGAIDQEKRENWLTQFQFSEQNRKEIHCSGHMSRPALEQMIKTIHPRKVFPIHTTLPEEFLQMGLDEIGIEVILPERNKSYSV